MQHYDRQIQSLSKVCPVFDDKIIVNDDCVTLDRFKLFPIVGDHYDMLDVSGLTYISRGVIQLFLHDRYSKVRQNHFSLLITLDKVVLTFIVKSYSDMDGVNRTLLLLIDRVVQPKNKQVIQMMDVTDMVFTFPSLGI